MVPERPNRFHTNLPFILSLAAATGIVVVSLLPRFSGGASWVLRVAAILLAAIGPIATQTEKRRVEEAQHLRVQVTAHPGSIAAFPDAESLIDAWLSEEQATCLRSLSDWEARQARPRGVKTFTIDATKGDGLTMNEWTDLEERKKKGEVLSAYEERKMRDAQETIAAAFAPFRNSLNFLGRRDERTEQEYRDEVGRYLEESKVAAMLRATEEFVASGVARIVVEVTNPTEQPYESAVVELSFPEGVEVFGWKEHHRDRTILPQRPDPFGVWQPYDFNPTTLAAIGSLGRGPFVLPASVEPALTIDGPRVKFRQVPVRALGPAELHELFVVCRVPEGSCVDVSWEATDGSALGRAHGTFQLLLSRPPEIESLLGGSLKGVDDDCGDDGPEVGAID